MALCEKSGQFLFQVMPDVFPHGRLTNIELELWDRFYLMKQQEENNE